MGCTVAYSESKFLRLSRLQTLRGTAFFAAQKSMAAERHLNLQSYALLRSASGTRSDPNNVLLVPPADSPLLPIVAAIVRAVEEGALTPNAGLSPLDMALSIWTQVHGIAVLRTRYLADTQGFDEKARQLVAASINAWSPRNRAQS